MTQGLRKRHLYFWVVLLILLPVGWFLSVKAIPPTPAGSQLVQAEIAAPLSEVIFSKDYKNSNISVRLLTDTSNQVQIELNLREVSQTAAAVLYISDQVILANSEAQLIGQIGTQGLYRFACGRKNKLPNPFFLHLTDPVKARSIFTYKIQH